MCYGPDDVDSEDADDADDSEDELDELLLLELLEELDELDELDSLESELDDELSTSKQYTFTVAVPPYHGPPYPDAAPFWFDTLNETDPQL